MTDRSKLIARFLGTFLVTFTSTLSANTLVGGDAQPLASLVTAFLLASTAVATQLKRYGEALESPPRKKKGMMGLWDRVVEHASPLA